MSSIHLVTATALIGIGATAVMDGWAFLLSRLGVPSAGFGMVGRWIGHMPRGRFAHDAIAKAAPVRNELGLGWLTHYAVGIAYAALLVALQGSAWLDQPTILPAVAVGVATLAAPWFLMQPAMGSGFMASKTPSPLQNRLRSLANHAVFGVGLYLTAAALARVVA